MHPIIILVLVIGGGGWFLYNTRESKFNHYLLRSCRCIIEGEWQKFIAERDNQTTEVRYCASCVAHEIEATAEHIYKHSLQSSLIETMHEALRTAPRISPEWETRERDILSLIAYKQLVMLYRELGRIGDLLSETTTREVKAARIKKINELSDAIAYTERYIFLSEYDLQLAREEALLITYASANYRFSELDSLPCHFTLS